jgi:hypothetical protein
MEQFSPRPKLFPPWHITRRWACASEQTYNERVNETSKGTMDDSIHWHDRIAVGKGTLHNVVKLLEP